MTVAALQIDALHYRYKRASKAALNGLSLTIENGSLFGLLGPNGAGKTTLLSLITAQRTASKGQILCFNHNLKQGASEQAALVPQDYAFYNRLSVEENLQFFAQLQTGSRASLAQEIADALTICELNKEKTQYAAHLSGGQKRRLNLAIGLLAKPQLLLLDEPTVGIDPHSRRHILETIKHINAQGTTIIYTSHYMNEVEYLCDDIAIIDHGAVVARGSQQALRQQYDSSDLEETFLNITQTQLRD